MKRLAVTEGMKAARWLIRLQARGPAQQGSRVEGAEGEEGAERQLGGSEAGRMLGQRAWLHALSSGGSRRGRSRHSD